jgi:putative phage-type endonuclease
MPITETQRERRSKHIGSSDVAPIMGASRWATAYDVWLEKTGKLVEKSDENQAMTAGNMFESGVLQWAEEHLGKMTRNQYRSEPKAYLGCNIDAIVDADGVPVDAKTGGLFGPLADDWGDEGTDQVPDEVILQAHAHMIVVDAVLCHIPAFLGGRGSAWRGAARRGKAGHGKARIFFKENHSTRHRSGCPWMNR